VKKIVLCLILIGTLSINLFSEVVYLKDKSIIKGKIIEQNMATLTLQTDGGNLVIDKTKIDNIDFSNEVKRNDNVGVKSDKDFYDNFFQEDSSKFYKKAEDKNKNVRGGFSFYGGTANYKLKSNRVVEGSDKLVVGYINSGSNRNATLIGMDFDFSVGKHSTIGPRIEYMQSSKETFQYYYNSYSNSNSYYSITGGSIYSTLLPMMFGYRYNSSSKGASVILGAYMGLAYATIHPLTSASEKMTGFGSIVDFSFGVDIPLGSSVAWRSGVSYFYAPISNWTYGGRQVDNLTITFSGYTLTTGLDFKF